jgi:endoglucanase
MTKFIKRKISFLLALIMFISVFSITDSFAAHELIENNTFDQGVGLPWHIVVNDPAKASFDISGGKYNITVQNPGDNRWDVQLRHKGLTLKEGRTYNVKFTIYSTKNCKIYAKIGDHGEPYNEYWNYNNRSWSAIELQANRPVTVEESFTMTSPTTDKCEFAFYLGGDLCVSGLPYTVRFDNIYLTDPMGTQPLEPPLDLIYDISVNQEGYFSGLNKIATLNSHSTTPVEWKLLTSSGTAVASGKTTVKGFDQSSGDKVHIIDFSSFTTLGNGYRLAVGTSTTSMPFDIRNDLYSDLKYQALKYFYYNRSGIPIVMPYADNIEITRIAANPLDIITQDPREEGTENYSLDITGGWINDDDDGKSVVNSGLATWILMNQYEHALFNGNAFGSPYADGTLNILESGNGCPDILDEARYNLQAMLNMQVPSGKALSGMVHHKVIHRRVLTSAGVETKRFLQPPSTAATLNLAAVAAQGARLWGNYDPEFSNKCLVAAETAWDAAIANPERFVANTPGTITTEYGDDYVGDEFYWAACELYITTGKDKYLDYIENSKHYLEIPTTLTGGVDVDTTGCFDWCNTAGLGTLSLYISPNRLLASDIAIARANIIKAADEFVSIANSQGYGVPINECTIDGLITNSNGEVSSTVGFPYSSNSFIVNEAIVMAYAYDCSFNIKYLNGIVGAMDYILGRNPRNQSYITGYGYKPVENPHHIFWDYRNDDSLPTPPTGCLSSGPNSGLQDDWVKGAGWKGVGIPPEKCFMDCAESWSTNNLDINLNAPLAWVSAYIDENVIKMPPPPLPFFGDVNDDDSIDALDLAAIKKYLLSQDDILLYIERADVNGDGLVDALDYALLKQYLLGIIKAFPVQVMGV